ncbi:MAG: metalloregulator ArsR/SmtB family transcription factor [Dysgonamonadaceae bacterium]|nr:metalloregulator ArsR/SmtB family transcription factor [Dysgonamonadaceae bacterium]MDD4245582.1 metalloregulator ArsR/SmtB family transcription factor [Dysgonamonadaceae bacterium]MDD4605281.1 metalloregulator ArsR/SmtB family transcription factor [Dysgonamonadaceae bacterium]HUI33028.1 metalloregulator ArsR/SmtB family transcription factor [Dysgonamonadaceae bacterium]
MDTCSCIDMSLEVTNIDIDKLERAAYILRALAHETRLCALMHLSHSKEKSVSDLMHELNCEQSLLSHHLTDLRAKGILNSRREGRNNFYSINNEAIIPLLECILNYCK